jgi:predicted TIM-barrel fold metal-dependent hydrolase
MDTRFFDANAFIGRPNNGVFKAVATARELLDEMDARGIDRALVWHIVQYEESPVHGNDMLDREIEGKDRLTGVWTILPPQTGEVVTKDFFARMKQHRIGALWAFPEWHRYLLHPVAFGDFLAETEKRRVPLMFTMGRACIGWQALYDLLVAFPKLTCILCDIGIWGVDRFTWPLLEKFPNVYLETSLLSLEAGGVEAAVAKFGGDRFVFGTGFPERYPEAAILQLVHADIADADRTKIASGNLTRILKEERL